MLLCCLYFCVVWSNVFFFNDTATTEIYTLSLHDALPISLVVAVRFGELRFGRAPSPGREPRLSGALSQRDRKSTRLNSSHSSISYAVFCLKKKIARKQKVARTKLHAFITHVFLGGWVGLE